MEFSLGHVILFEIVTKIATAFYTYCVFSTIWSSLHTVAHLILVTDIIIIIYFMD